MNSVIFFDGVCNLCNASINFIIDHDKKQFFLFSSLQSNFFKVLLSSNLDEYKISNQNGLEKVTPSIQSELQSLNSIVYLENKIFYTKSDAVIRIGSHLGGLFSYSYFFKIFPKSFRDGIYEWIASNRYKWFGKKESCRIPTPDLKKRFLD
ncbi:MAG TPA: DCC1-like thiol-disulfide oxidoreductase family protein [Leptospiraceae bacterium]|nr:DCC1-like thiol-disulfide oxidoreductase family protein [Leptospiraceae bacterium]HMW04495.1 DCC1-like thiol-disulfide oxidoreductase family protein [Leptospiraceae bacterium]HMX31153.1 DCC1-like thiol-disulfide oxidoreductase family protein [Leptospiraceae bacterium]HMY30681.1 DCC1-like thiol-disulfide oxidoreductase family protein [Leptospiraceae bacterium]HMZ63250.1 DCC1-like thiol-disulfide oxidoreductase family protein [Leptospiraceae bacterium]